MIKTQFPKVQRSLRIRMISPTCNALRTSFNCGHFSILSFYCPFHLVKFCQWRHLVTVSTKIFISIDKILFDLLFYDFVLWQTITLIYLKTWACSIDIEFAIAMLFFSPYSHLRDLNILTLIIFSLQKSRKLWFLDTRISTIFNTVELKFDYLNQWILTANNCQTNCSFCRADPLHPCGFYH